MDPGRRLGACATGPSAERTLDVLNLPGGVPRKVRWRWHHFNVNRVGGSDWNVRGFLHSRQRYGACVNLPMNGPVCVSPLKAQAGKDERATSLTQLKFGTSAQANSSLERDIVARMSLSAR